MWCHLSRRLRWALTLALLATVMSIPSVGPIPVSAAPMRQPPLPTDRVPDPHQAGVQWFAATGHTVRGTFLTYWTKYGGLAQFGYPITEEFPDSGLLDQPPQPVQYFERARFEQHREYIGTPYEVLLGRLGAEFHAPDPPTADRANPATQYFPQTGHNVIRPFYNYWQSHGGLFVNGYPISEPLSEVSSTDGRTYTVQYFERVRYELHPGNAGTPYEVLLGLLGTQLAGKKGYFPPSTPVPPR